MALAREGPHYAAPGWPRGDGGVDGSAGGVHKGMDCACGALAMQAVTAVQSGAASAAPKLRRLPDGLAPTLATGGVAREVPQAPTVLSAVSTATARAGRGDRVRRSSQAARRRRDRCRPSVGLTVRHRCVCRRRPSACRIRHIFSGVGIAGSVAAPFLTDSIGRIACRRFERSPRRLQWHSGWPE